MSRVLLVGALSGPFGQAARIAAGKGAQVLHADGVADALTILRADSCVDTVLCDITFDIASLVRSMKAERLSAPVIAGGLDISPDSARRAVLNGARDVLDLPPDPELLAALLLGAGSAPNAPVVRDPAMIAVLRKADHVATAEASVLITGESGTGKEVMARYIHARSRRSAGPFVALNCAAIPEALLESELFGHEKGAFSGALARRIGKFETASGGTLLLDEISEMDLRLQAKLLRAIQEREIDRVGGSAPVRVDVRILATSNRDLRAEAQAGRFREDLFFRINVISLNIPPLRERPADIPALATHYARHYAKLNGIPERPLGRDALLRLSAHRWRGNVRELENAMHSAVLLAGGDEINADAIELPPSASAAAGCETTLPQNFIGRRMEDLEREIILQTLNQTSGNRTHAATVLGISIRALRNKLRDYARSGIAVPPPQSAAAA